MNKTQRILLLSIVCIITFFVNNQVLVPDIMESRNIITAREMARGGDWIVPTMNGELRLEKPPLPTWVTAIAEMAAPDNVALQRAGAGLAALLLAFFFYKYASRVLKIEPVVPTLLLCTCYNVILMGRTASWDIYTHAFMMGGIYFLALALQKERRSWGDFMGFAIFTGLSIMSKGPVSLFALFLPFLLSYCYFYRPKMRGKWGALGVAVVVALAIGGWWYLYVHIACADAWQAVMAKESGAWLEHNVRPWYYYWKFFLETGVWSLLLLLAMFLPLANPSRRRSRKWMFAMGWMLCSLLLLSLMPEKKPRYLLPLLIPACYVMGCLLAWWRESFRDPARAARADKLSFRINCGLIAVAVALLPVLAWFFFVAKDYMPILPWTIFSLLCLVIAYYLAAAAVKLKPTGMVLATTALFLVSECMAMPYLKNIINNPERHSIEATRDIRRLDGLQFYNIAAEPIRIEMVYAADRTIRPIDPDTLGRALPCVLLTHEPVGKALPARLLEGVDTIVIDRYDDNRRPKGTRRYRRDMIYYVTILRSKTEK